jgi:3-hydroxyacyl-CoA dehydrogenase
MSGSLIIRLKNDSEIGIIIVNYPPVNALGPGASEGIIDSLNNAKSTPPSRP